MTDSTGESGFVIDGTRYEVPTLDTITIDEEESLYVISDFVVGDFLNPHPDWSAEEKIEHVTKVLRRVRDPRFKRALAFIAYKRENPDVEDSEVDKLLGKLIAVDVDYALLSKGEELDPQISQRPQDETKLKSPQENSTDSGTSTESDSENQDTPPEATGTPESDTSSPGALPIGLAS